ncbi:MAG: glycerophosphodiester phosphodiesterase [Clostridia bacterium]|jgi:glycerophosphoryl diester phosphodiesterase|nr:glycerophosphodiester phosphodiesterase [Clostridia bacterium]
MNTRILAHRGASFYAPENTMPSFELALEQGADGVELDVHFSKDGELVVMHDERVDRTTDGKGFIKDFTLAELKALDASNGMEGFRGVTVPTLSEVYDLFAGTEKLINVEIKTDIIDYPGICGKLKALEIEKGMTGRIIYSSFNHYTVREMKKLDPGAKVGLLYMSIFAEPWKYALEMNAQCLHPHFITISKTPHMAEECNARGIETNIWTVDDSAWMERLANMGVTSLITDKPDLARTVVFGISS